MVCRPICVAGKGYVFIVMAFQTRQNYVCRNVMMCAQNSWRAHKRYGAHTPYAINFTQKHFSVAEKTLWCAHETVMV